MKYEIRKRGDGKQAIFDETGKQISPGWYDEIYSSGLIKGQSPYYKVKKGNRTAIFDKDGNQITKWFYRISSYGLVSGESDLYIANATKKDGKWAIFNKDGKMISPEWFDRIYEDELVNGQGHYFIACNDNNCAVYYKDGKKVSDDFSRNYIKKAEKINFNENLGIVELFDKNENLIESIDFNPIYPFKEEIIDYTKLLNI
jgi:hypothetical protein